MRLYKWEWGKSQEMCLKLASISNIYRSMSNKPGDVVFQQCHYRASCKCLSNEAHYFQNERTVLAQSPSCVCVITFSFAFSHPSMETKTIILSHLTCCVLAAFSSKPFCLTGCVPNQVSFWLPDRNTMKAWANMDDQTVTMTEMKVKTSPHS